MKTINLWDDNFAHLTCSIHGKTAKEIIYSRNNLVWDDITIFTDSKIFDGTVDRVQSPIKIAWLMEPPAISPGNYSNIHNVINKFNLILTCDEGLIKSYPGKAIMTPAGGVWINDWHPYKLNEEGIRPISIIYSGKSLTEGHRLRPTMASHPDVEKFGAGAGRHIATKEEGLIPYLFHIAIENSKINNYFSEKLLDCFATSTIPIYWGCPNIGEFFNTDGMIIFNNPQEVNIDDILLHANEIYESKKEAIKDNYERVKKFEVTDDWIYKTYLEK